MKKAIIKWISNSRILFIVLSVAIVAFASALYVYEAKRNLRDFYLDLKEVSDSKVHILLNWIDERENDARNIQESNVFSMWTNSWMKSRDPYSMHMMQDHINAINSTFVYSDVLLYDLNGDLNAIIVGDTEPKNPDTGRLVIESFQTGKVVWGEFYLCSECKKDEVDIFVPIHYPPSGRGRVIAVLQMSVAAAKYLDSFISEWPPLTATGDVLVLRQSELSRFNNARYDQNRYPKGIPLEKAMTADTNAITAGTFNHRGAEILCAVKKVPGKPWYIAAVMSGSEVRRAMKSWVLSLLLSVLFLNAMLWIVNALVIATNKRNQYKKQYEMELEQKILLQHIDYITKYANDIIFLIDETGRIVQANDRAFATYGYNIDEITKLRVLDLRTERFRASYESDFKRAAEKGGIIYETEHQRKDGSVLPVEVSLRRFEIGKKRYFQAIIRDITDRKNSETALKASEQQKDLILNSVPVAIYISNLDPQTDTAWISGNVKMVTGFSAEEYLSQPDFWRKRLHPEDREIVLKAFENATEEGEGDIEYRWLHKNGRYRWYQDRFLVRDIGGTREILGLINDIHDHKMSHKRETILYAISQASHTSSDLRELYKHLHEIVSELIPARNFYISLLSEDGKMLHFPYYVDEVESHQPPRTLGLGLTEYVLKTKSPLLITPQLYRELQEHKKLEAVGALFHNWLGVPLTTEGKIIGVLAVQSYNEGEQYDEIDRDMLVFVSDHIAEAISRKRGQEALQESEAKHSHLLSSIALPVLSLQEDLTVYYCNQAYADFVGLSIEQIEGRKLLELFPDFEKTNSYDAYLACLQTGQPQVVEGVMKDGVYLCASIYKTSNGLLAVCEDITERRMAENALEQSEYRYRTTLDAVNEMIHVIDKDYNIQLMNKTFIDYCRNNGICEDCNGKNIFDIFPFLPQSVNEEYAKVFSGKESVISEDVIIINKREIITKTRKIPILENGQVVRVVTVITDITDLKKQEDAIRESREKYQSVFDNSNDGIFIMKDDTFVDCNKALLTMFAMDRREDIVGKTPETTSPEYQDNGLTSKEYGRQLIDKALSGKIQFFDWKHRKKAGEIFECEISLSRLELKGEYYLMAILRDVTEKKESERKLRENEQRYTIVVEKTGHLVYDYNVATGKIKWSGAVKEVTGYGSKEIEKIGIEEWEALIHPDDKEFVLNHLEACLSTVSSFDVEYRLKKADGQYIFVSDHGIFLPGKEGKAERMLGTMADVTERKRMDISLKQSEERYKTLFTDTLESLSITKKGILCDVNSAWLKLHKYDNKDEVIGKDITEILAPQDRGVIIERRARVFSNDTERIFEARDMTKAGEIIEVEVSSSTIILDGEEAIISAIQNISKKKQDEKRLRELNKRFEYVLGATKTGFDIIDPEHNIIYINPEWEKEYGTCEKDKCYKYFMNRDSVCENCGIDTALKTKTTTITEEFLIKEKRWVEVHTIPYRNEDGGWVVAEFNIDITQRKRDQKIMENRQKALQEVYKIATSLDETFQGICDRVAINLSQILEVPHMAVQLLKNGKINVISYYGEGKIENNMILPLEGSPCEKAYQKGQPLEINGSLRQIFPKFFLNEKYDLNSYLGMPIKNRKGKVTGLICIYDYRQHIFNQEEMVLLEIFAHYIGYEIERSEMENSLREADKGKLLSDIASGVAHEVRNPLHAIQAITEAMAKGIDGNPDYAEYLMHIKMQVSRLSQLMKDLLELGKPVPSSEFIREPVLGIVVTAKKYWQDAQTDTKNNIELQNNLDSEIYIYADAAKIQEVVINLLDNAVQHSPAGKSVTIELSQQGHENVTIKIIDQGTGVKPQTEEKVFEPFYTTRRKGTGLGLAICKRIIESHEGNIQLTNNINMPGCTVQFTLPVCKEEKA
ncbi:PAS domain S-box protein [candidate division TA06 bacterium]|nr:PAS domain S-box protein [candidate division TA06 bacterium]